MANPRREGYRGYVTSREFGGARIPVPVQSLVLRDYCTRKGFIYKLHLNENMFPHSYLVLEGLVRNLGDFEGVVMCSMFMLPQRRARRDAIYRTIVDQGAQLHLVLEDIVVRSMADVRQIEDVLEVTRWLPHAPTGMPVAPR